MNHSGHVWCTSWLGIRDGNITFQDSLDFDLTEIDSVYDDGEGDR